MSTTRTKIIESSEKLMLKKGFNSTTIDEIARDAGLTKGALFHYFKSKEEIAKIVLQSYWRETIKSLQSHMLVRNNEKSSFENLIAAVDFFESILLEKDRTSACLIGNLAQEVALTNEEIRQTCQQIFSEWLDSLTELIEIACKDKGMQLDSKGLAELIVSSVEGAFILLKSGNDNEQPKRIVHQLKTYLQLLFNAH